MNVQSAGVRLLAVPLTIPLAILGAALLSACSVLPRPQTVNVERYTLEAAVSATPADASNGAGPVLLITRPLARTDLDTPRMAYRQQDYALRYFANSRWADSPPQLMLPGLIEAFEASGRYAAVVRLGSAAVPRLRLDVDVLDFSQDFRSRPSQFGLRLRVQLLDLETREVLASRLFDARRAAPEDSPYGGARAANAAWQALLPEIVRFIGAHSPGDVEQGS